MRHGQKAYKNNKTAQHIFDAPLKDLKSPQVCEKINDPLISTSPLLRTRQTAALIAASLDNPSKTLVANELLEFLGNHKQAHFATVDFLKTEHFFHRETALLITQASGGTWTQITTLTQESKKQAKSRIVQFFLEIQAKKENVILVTHGFLISLLGDYLGLKDWYPVEGGGFFLDQRGLSVF